MRNKTAALFLILFVSYGLSAQVYQLPNPSFEDWDGNTSDDEPTYWNGFPSAACDLSFPASLGCGTATETRHEKSTDTRPGSSGSYSCKLFATSALGIIANGTITTGQIRIGSTTASSDENYDITRQGDSQFNQQFDSKPDSIRFWAKFICPSSTQTAKLSAVIHNDYDYRDPDGSDSNAESHAVAKAAVYFTKGSEIWVQYSAPFDYNHPASNGTYILITFSTNSESGQGSTEDVLFIDDIEFIYNSLLDNISLNGETISGFDPETGIYTIDMECGESTNITATSQSDNADISITQATLSNSTATITCSAGDQSTEYTINFNFTTVSEITAEVCQNESYSENGFDLPSQSASGTFNHTITSYQSESCDSIINLVLTVHPNYTPDTVEVMICETGSYNFFGQNLTEAGIYEETVLTMHNCDSTVTLNLTVGEFYRTYINAAICDGETYIDNGFDMNETGIDTLSYTATNGCDSIVILNLDVNPLHLTELSDTVYQGGTYLNYGFEIFATNSPGIYTFENILENEFGCDSVVSLELEILELAEDTIQPPTGEFGFMLYPNPSTDEVILQAEGHIDFSLEYIIYDLFGKFIGGGTIINDETAIEINKYAAGVYFIKIISDQGDSETMKFIKY